MASQKNRWLLHDLQVQQVELEIQNEELRRTQKELIAARERYFDLYNHAPVGYCTLDPKGKIVEANHTAMKMLGADQEALLNQPFSRFILADDQDIFYRHSRKLFALKEAQDCELRLLRPGEPPFWASLNGVAAVDESGQALCRMTISDITARKKIEAVMTARLRLKKMAGSHRLVEILQTTVDEAEVLTDSRIGFYHLLAKDWPTGFTQAWSTNTIGKMCQVAGRESSCAMNHAGLWPECIEQGRPVVHNELATLPGYHRLPPGHPGVTRELVVPVVRGEVVVALLGVGNKPVPYTDQDVEVMVTLADLLWDIAEHRRAEEALRQSERERLQVQEIANALLREQTENLESIYRVLDSVGLIICRLEESDARIEIFNPGAEKLFGYRQEEALGQSIRLIYPPALSAQVPDRAARLRRGEAFQSFQMTVIHQSGAEIPVVVSVHPFDYRDGQYRKSVGVFRDITEMVVIQKELEASNLDLERRVEERTLELQETQQKYLHAEKLSAIGKLSASIAHEFNNPLQGILAILKGLQKRAILEEEDRELLAAAIGESDRIKSLIRSLQEFNRPSPGRKILLDVHGSLDAMLLLHKSEFKSRRITVQRNYAPGLPQILAVPDQIKQVFLNLLTNAADACQMPGGVITVTTRCAGDRLAVIIEDTGIGIKEEEMSLIFQPFFTTKPEVKGTGLGLPVCYGIVKEHGGEIFIESRPGVGTTCTVLLPVSGREEPSGRRGHEAER
ncbi:MAG: PAS domain-containing protein [Desulforhopalus sp.]|nr:PAS domain-containing protein [Desulforhopalus sp.]